MAVSITFITFTPSVTNNKPMAQVRITLPPALDRKVENLQAEEKERNGGVQLRTKADQCVNLIEIALDALSFKK